VLLALQLLVKAPPAELYSWLWSWGCPSPRSATCQQPGSPGWPQQLLRVRSLIQLLRTSSRSLRCKGMGARIFVNTDFRLGLFLAILLTGFL